MKSQDLKSIDWDLMGYYRHCPMIDWLVVKGWKREFFKDADIDYEPEKVVVIDHEYYFTQEDKVMMDSTILKKMKQKGFIHFYLRKCNSGCNHLLRISKNIRKLDLKKIPNSELKNLLNVWSYEFLKEMHFYLDMMSFV